MLRKHPLAVLLTAVLVLSACSDETATEPTAAPELAPVSFSAASVSAALAVPAELEAQIAALPTRHLVILKPGGARTLERAVEELGGRVFFRHDATGLAGVEGLDAAGAEALAGVQGVAMVEPERLLPMAEPTFVSEPMAATPASPADPSGATFFPWQWNMMAIGADQAWAAGRTGSPDVTVAILDTGIGYIHPDLAGLVDLARSASFIPIDDLFVGFFFPGAHPIADIGYHGTHVAATVASNGLVAAGVTSQVTLMGVRVCSVVEGGCPTTAIVQGILHAVDNGADVVNMSLGGFRVKAGSEGVVAAINTLFNYAKQHDVTMVVSAGNDSADLDRHLVPIEVAEDEYEIYRFPSLFKTYCDATHVVCVSATGPVAADGNAGPWYDIDAPAPYTNFGRSAIDVAAPGGSTGGPIRAACSPFSLVATICQTGVYVISLNGTSMAAPHVSGLAALAVEDVGKNVGRVSRYIRGSADAIGGGNTPYYGKGRINVARAVGAQ